MSGRENLPFLDLKGFQGLYTKSNQEIIEPDQLRVAQNCDFFEVYGAVSKIRGSTRVLNSVYQENGSTKEISWIDFYKAPDLDGTILRQTLVAAGTVIGRIENGGITPLLTGRTADLFHSSDMFDRFMLITNQNPDRVGEGDQLVKFDSAVFSRWGVAAPGENETVVEDFDDQTDWTAAFCTKSNQTNATSGHVTWDGDSMRIDKEFYQTKVYSVDRAHENPFYPQGDARSNVHAVRNRVALYVYIPRGQLTASLTHPTDRGFATSGPMLSIYVSRDTSLSTRNAWQFDFTNANIVEGWNKLNLDFASGAPGSGQTNSPAGQQLGLFYPEVHAIFRTKLEFYVATPNTSVTGVRVDRYHKLDEGAPVPIASGTGDIDGTYSYKVVYVSKYGQLSNAGPKSVDVVADSVARITLTRIPVSPDPQVVARRLYRTVGNGSVWLFLDEILDNVSTTYVDVVPDGSLSNETPPQAGDFSDDNSLPPQGGIVKVWKKTVFIAGDPQNPYTLYYSDDDEPESFPLINTFEMDSKITAMYESYAGLVIETENGKWQVAGENPDFSLDKIVHNMGCVGRRAAGTARLIGYAVDRDGLRLFDTSETKKISEPIRDKYDTDIDKVNIELIHTVHSHSKNAILQFNPDSNGDYTSIFCYQYPIDDVTQGYWSTIHTPTAANLNFRCAVEIEDSNGDYQLLAGGADGMIYRLFDDSSKNWVDANGTAYAIDTQLQIPYVRPGSAGLEGFGATGRVLPRWVEMRVGTDDAAVWTVTVETADGIDQALSRSSTSMSMQFGANNSLIRQAVPSADCTPGEYVRLTFRNNETSVYTKILASRLYFKVQPGQFEVLDVDNTVS